MQGKRSQRLHNASVQSTACYLNNSSNFQQATSVLRARSRVPQRAAVYGSCATLTTALPRLPPLIIEVNAALICSRPTVMCSTLYPSSTQQRHQRQRNQRAPSRPAPTAPCPVGLHSGRKRRDDDPLHLDPGGWGWGWVGGHGLMGARQGALAANCWVSSRRFRLRCVLCRCPFAGSVASARPPRTNPLRRPLSPRPHPTPKESSPGRLTAWPRPGRGFSPRTAPQAPGRTG